MVVVLVAVVAATVLGCGWAALRLLSARQRDRVPPGPRMDLDGSERRLAARRADR